VTEETKIRADELKRLFPSCHWLDVPYKEGEPSDFVIQQIIENFLQAISLIQRLKFNEGHINRFIGNIYFSREIQGNYLYEISLGRAQRIVWRNILQAFEIDNPAPPLFISTLPVMKNGLHDHFLIEATAKTLSAVLGGADIIYLEFDEITEVMRPENLSHIHNILNLESGIGEIIDPVAGSFYVDELTTKLAQQIWSNLKS
jgi:methylmalonyl-CoA mutase